MECLKAVIHLYYASQSLRPTELGLVQLVTVISEIISIYGDRHVEHTNGMFGERRRAY